MPADQSGGPSPLGRPALLGAVSGMLSGLFGLGGGLVIVPGLLLVIGMGQRRAAATSLAAVVPISAAGLLGYSLAGEVDWLLGLILAGASIVGSLAGAALLSKIPERHATFALALLLVLVALRMLGSTTAAIERPDLDAARILGVVALGAIAGLISGLFGVGGGFIVVPALVLFFSEPSTLAKGASLLAILISALVTTLSNARRARVDWRVASAVGSAGVATSFVSSRIAVGLPEALANRLFAVLLVVVSANLVLRQRRRPRPRSGPGG